MATMDLSCKAQAQSSGPIYTKWENHIKRYHLKEHFQVKSLARFQKSKPSIGISALGKSSHRVSYSMQLTLEFGGGLELLCNSVKVHEVNVDLQAEENQKLTMKRLLSWVRTNLIKERPEMFMKGDTVRPGVLVLVNDCDWELSGQLDTTLEEKDVIVFISTLHGG